MIDIIDINTELLDRSKVEKKNEKEIDELSAHPIGTLVGAASGAGAATLAGAAIAGPAGAVAGAIFGAVAGGLTGNEVAEAVNPTADEIEAKAYKQEVEYSNPQSKGYDVSDIKTDEATEEAFYDKATDSFIVKPRKNA